MKDYWGFLLHKTRLLINLDMVVSHKSRASLKWITRRRNELTISIIITYILALFILLSTENPNLSTEIRAKFLVKDTHKQILINYLDNFNTTDLQL